MRYLPANAQITAVSVFTDGPTSSNSGSPSTATATLTSDQFVAANGTITLTNVGFGLLTSGNPLWDNKASSVRVGVKVTAHLPDGSTPDRTVYLEKVVPLYNAGEIAGAAGHRYGNLFPTLGSDGWSTGDTYNFISQRVASSALPWLFNDVSREHGGVFHNVPSATPDPMHHNHRWGLEMDVRYFGMAVSANQLGLNGASGENDQGTHRLAALTAARNAQTAVTPNTSDPNWVAIVQWIKDNRNVLDCLTGSNLP